MIRLLLAVATACAVVWAVGGELRFFAERIVWISDMAEEVADKLTIYAIKRTI